MEKRIRRIISLILALCLCASTLLSCGDEEGADISPDDSITLSIGVLGAEDKITFSEELFGESITLGDGLEYKSGDLKPVWRMLSEVLGVEIVEVTADEELRSCDLVIGDARELDRLGREGLLLNLSDCFSVIADAKDALFENETVFSYLGESKYGEAGLYFIPMLCETPAPDVSAFINEAAVKALLDGDFIGSDKHIEDFFVKPYMPDEGEIYTEVLSDSGELETICKNYLSAGNILELFGALSESGLTGNDAITLLKAYIDKAYGGYYGEHRSNLFVGANAAYDADELCALLICIKANSAELGLGEEIVPAAASMDDAVKMMASLYGIRGLGGEGYTYINASGELCDCRTEAETYELFGKINDWISSGLLLITDENETLKDGTTGTEAVEQDGIAEYVLSFSEYKSEDGAVEMLPPVARWYDGSNMDGARDLGAYFRFSESLTRTESIGIGVSKKGTVSSQKRREAALKLIEIAFTEEGRGMLLCESIANADAEADELGYLRTEDYLEDYYGAGICFISPSFPRYIGTRDSSVTLADALDTGLIKSPTSARGEGRNWYTEVPLLLPYTAEEYNSLLTITEFTSNPTALTPGYGEISAQIIRNGLIGAGFVSGEEASEHLFAAHKAEEYLALLSEAYNRLIIYYYEYQKGVEY